MPKADYQISPDSRIIRCPQLPVGLSLPSPINERLNGLVDIANDAGANTRRKELIGALILAAQDDGEDLSEKLKTYRKARAKDAAFRRDSVGKVLMLHEQKPGPKARYSAD